MYGYFLELHNTINMNNCSDGFKDVICSFFFGECRGRPRGDPEIGWLAIPVPFSTRKNLKKLKYIVDEWEHFTVLYFVVVLVLISE